MIEIEEYKNGLRHTIIKCQSEMLKEETQMHRTRSRQFNSDVPYDSAMPYSTSKHLYNRLFNLNTLWSRLAAMEVTSIEAIKIFIKRKVSELTAADFSTINEKVLRKQETMITHSDVDSTLHLRTFQPVHAYNQQPPRLVLPNRLTPSKYTSHKSRDLFAPLILKRSSRYQSHGLLPTSEEDEEQSQVAPNERIYDEPSPIKIMDDTAFDISQHSDNHSDNKLYFVEKADQLPRKSRRDKKVTERLEYEKYVELTQIAYV